MVMIVVLAMKVILLDGCNFHDDDDDDVFKTFPVSVFVLLRGVEKEAHTQSSLGKNTSS